MGRTPWVDCRPPCTLVCTLIPTCHPWDAGTSDGVAKLQVLLTSQLCNPPVRFKYLAHGWPSPHVLEHIGHFVRTPGRGPVDCELPACVKYLAHRGRLVRTPGIRPVDCKPPRAPFSVSRFSIW